MFRKSLLCVAALGLFVGCGSDQGPWAGPGGAKSDDQIDDSVVDNNLTITVDREAPVARAAVVRSDTIVKIQLPTAPGSIWHQTNALPTEMRLEKTTGGAHDVFTVQAPELTEGMVQLLFKREDGPTFLPGLPEDGNPPPSNVLTAEISVFYTIDGEVRAGRLLYVDKIAEPSNDAVAERSARLGDIFVVGALTDRPGYKWTPLSDFPMVLSTWESVLESDHSLPHQGYSSLYFQVSKAMEANKTHDLFVNYEGSTPGGYDVPVRTGSLHVKVTVDSTDGMVCSPGQDECSAGQLCCNSCGNLLLTEPCDYCMPAVQMSPNGFAQCPLFW